MSANQEVESRLNDSELMTLALRHERTSTLSSGAAFPEPSELSLENDGAYPDNYAAE